MRKQVVLGLGAVMGIGYLILLGYLLWGDWPNTLQPAATPVAEVTTTPPTTTTALWEAYQQAQAAAQAEAPDAQLVSASTQWEDPDETQLLDGTHAWSFVFYSAETAHVLDVVVGEGAGQVVNQVQVWADPALLSAGAWQDGPRDALLVFLAHGGRDFLEQHAAAVIDLHLSEDVEQGAVWNVVALAPGEETPFAVSLDADTRAVLRITP